MASERRAGLSAVRPEMRARRGAVGEGGVEFDPEGGPFGLGFEEFGSAGACGTWAHEPGFDYVVEGCGGASLFYHLQTVVPSHTSIRSTTSHQNNLRLTSLGFHRRCCTTKRTHLTAGTVAHNRGTGSSISDRSPTLGGKGGESGSDGHD